MQRDIQNLLRLLFLVIAILMMKTASGADKATHQSTPPNAEGGATIIVPPDASKLARKTVY